MSGTTTATDDLSASLPSSRADDQGKFIWAGSAGVVNLLPNGNALKTPHEYAGRRARESVLRNVLVESKIYERLSPHPRILRFISYSPEQGIEFEYAPGGTLKSYLKQYAEIDMRTRLQWARDVAEGMAWLHLHKVIHCDMKPENVLLDASLRLKTIDFEGSSLDGGYHSTMESTRYCRPRPWEEQSTISTDLFALGSTIYEIMTSQPPYHDRSDEEVERLFTELHFPDVSELPCAKVMLGCWHGTLSSADAVLKLVDEDIELYQHSQP